MIVFCFPRQENKAGGGHVLIVNVAIELSKKNIPFTIIDYSEGYVNMTLKELGLEYTFLEYEKIRYSEVSFTQKDVIINLGNYYENLYPLKQFTKSRVLFWEVVNHTVISMYNVRRGKNGRYLDGAIIPHFFIKRFLHKLIRKNGFYTINADYLLKLKRYGEEINKIKCIPVPVYINKETGITYKYEKKDVLRITYVGRAVEWKVFAVARFLEDLPETEGRKKIILNIVSDSTVKFSGLLNGLQPPLNNIDLVYHDNVLPQDLNAFLMETTDLLFAMGTAALDGGKLGIPTILAEASYSRLPRDYKYIWLLESSNYNFGERILLGSKLYGNELHILLEPFFADDLQKIKTISAGCFNYVNQYHSMDGFIEKFIKAVENTTMTMADLKGMFRYVTVKIRLYKLFSHLVSLKSIVRRNPV